MPGELVRANHRPPPLPGASTWLKVQAPETKHREGNVLNPWSLVLGFYGLDPKNKGSKSKTK